MRGPANEDNQLNAMNSSQGQGHNFSGYQHQPQYLQESANYNGNNRNAHTWNNVPSYSNGDAYHYHMHPPQEPEPSPQDNSNPFAEYTWMVDADEFDRQMMEQMEQEEYLESCFQQMWEEEENEGEWFVPPQDAPTSNPIQTENLEKLTLNETPQPMMLNPNAAEFVPRRAIVHH